MNSREVLDFPVDRSLVTPGLGRVSVTLGLPCFPSAVYGKADVEVLSFSALLVFARIVGQTDVQLAFAAGDALTGRSFLRADLAAELTVAQAFRSLQSGAVDPELSVVNLVVTPIPCCGIGTETVLAFDRSSDGLRLVLDFDAARLAPLSARDFLEKIELVLAALQSTPAARCGDLALLTTTASTLIPDLSRTILPDICEFAPQSFFAIAARYPNQPAIADECNTYTYSELSGAVRTLSCQLRAAGLEQGDIVAVEGLSSFGMLAAMLSVLTAGGVLVTIDRALPEARQAAIVEISQPRFLIQVGAAGAVQPVARKTLFITDWPAQDEVRQWSKSAPAASAVMAELPTDASAYVFFTSGSTGVPKGVLGTHLGLAHFLAWQRANFPIGPGDHAAQLTALSFDVVLRDVLFPLTSGACVHIPVRALLLDARRMLGWIQKHKITILHSVPSLMKAWLHAHTQGRPFGTLRYIFFAGEPLIDSLLTRLDSAIGADTRIINLYGPTETTLAKVANPLQRIEPGVQPIGYPQPGTDVVIFRDRRCRCGLWEVGEITIRTPYRSKGYLNDTEMTRRVFVRNPYRDDPEDLLYYTGDLGRYRSDGKIEIFGRIDSQIKIRGVRIEPNEIEGQLGKLPGVKDAAVTTRIGADETKVLLALVVPEAPMPRDLEAAFGRRLREDLKGKLHEAMVPARIMVTDRLPYLPNGKLDRKSLNALELELHAPTHVGVTLNADLSDDKRLLIARIETALHTRIDDLQKSFIDLGGDSLSYIQVSILIGDALGRVPDHWEKMPLVELVAQANTPRTVSSTKSWTGMETTLLCRALAIIMVTMSHTSAFPFISATSTLFIVSGMNFAKFLRPAICRAGDISGTLSMILKFAIPAGLWQGLRGLLTGRFWVPDLVLLGTFVRNPDAEYYTFWFLDVLAMNLIVLALIGKLSYHHRHHKGIPPAPDANTFSSDLACFAIGVSVAFVQVSSEWGSGQVGTDNVPPFKWFWMLALGVLIDSANTAARKTWLTLVLGGLALAAYSAVPAIAAPFTELDAFFFATALVLIWIKRINIPRLLQRSFVVIAAATLFIYIGNYSVIVHIMPKLGLPDWWPLEVALAVVAGVVAQMVWDKILILAIWLSRLRPWSPARP